MTVLISSSILALAIILLADSIRQLRPHRKKRKQNRSKKTQPMPRAKESGIDLTMTDLRRGGGSHD